MHKSSNRLVYFYAKKHWPSNLPNTLTASDSDVVKAAEMALKDLKKNATKNGCFVRLSGQSGSGKTTQLLPAAEKFFEKKKMRPILVAARELAKYHPHYDEILKKYGEEQIRKRTDDFATVLMYRVLRELTKEKYDLIIDVSFVSVKIETLFDLMTRKYRGKTLFLMAVSPEISEKLLAEREWRHDEELEKEFFNSTANAIGFYGKKCPEMRAIVWNFCDLDPVYDGGINGVLKVWQAEIKRTNFEKKYKIEELVAAKTNYILKH